jgi:hypothetical protein
VRAGFTDTVGEVVCDEWLDTHVLEDEPPEKDSVGGRDRGADSIIGWCLGWGMASLIDDGGGRKYQLILLAHGQVEMGINDMNTVVSI